MEELAFERSILLRYGYTELVATIVVLLILFFIIFRRRLVSSENYLSYALGMSIKWKDLLVFVLSMVVINYSAKFGKGFIIKLQQPLAILALMSYFLCLMNRFVRVIKYEKEHKDAWNHAFQTTALVCTCAYIIYAIRYFGGTMGLFTAVSALVFNDPIKGILSYYHLRSNNLLHIGDWINVPSHHIFGKIEDISLLTVTVKSIDNTINSIPMSVLQNGSFKNYRDVLEGRSSGRIMQHSFVIDLHSVKSMSIEDVESLKSKFAEINEDQIIFENFSPNTSRALNVHMFRMYVYHWLMNHSDITRQPQLIVRLLSPTSEGVPLQIEAYVSQTINMSYEFIQTSVIEHIIMSMSWFGLRLYQKPSSEDLFQYKNLIN